MTLKWEASAYKNPIARARGLGGSHSGTHHWLMQKVTAIANLFLVFWMVCSVVGLAVRGGGFGLAVDWVSAPVHAVLILMFIVSSFYHAALGLRVVVEDYFHSEKLKMAFLIGIKLLFAAMSIAAIFSVVKIAL